MFPICIRFKYNICNLTNPFFLQFQFCLANKFAFGVLVSYIVCGFFLCGIFCAKGQRSVHFGRLNASRRLPELLVVPDPALLPLLSTLPHAHRRQQLDSTRLAIWPFGSLCCVLAALHARVLMRN